MEEKRGLAKDEVMKREKRRMSALFSVQPGEPEEANKKKKKLKAAAASLIEEAGFMAGTLYELREIINKKGYTEEYQNGQNQKGLKKASEVEIYNTTIKNYMNCVKQIKDMIPEDSIKPKEDDDGFEEFVAGK